MKPVSKILSYNVPLKIFSLVFAYGIWYTCAHSITTDKTIHIPVYIHHAVEHTIVNAPHSIQVTLRGKLPLMRTIENQLITLHIDAQNCQKPVDWIAVKESDLSIPYDVQLVHCYPSMIAIATHTTDKATI